MYLSKAYNDNDKRLRIKRNPVHSVILPSVNTLKIDGNDYSLIPPDNFLGLKKAFKKIKEKLQKKSKEFEDLGKQENLPTSLGVYALGGKFATDVLAKTTELGEPIANIVDVGGSAVLIGTGAKVIKDLVKVGLPDKVSLGDKSIDTGDLINKGKDLAIEKGKNLAVDIIKNKLAGGSSYTIDEKPDTSLMYNQSGNDNTLAAGTPINFANPWLLIGVIIFFIILVAIKKMR